MVAIELAASCRPFRKSNRKATPIRAASTIKAASTGTALVVLYDDAADAVGHVLEAVHHLLQVTVDLAADDELHRIAAAALQEQCFQPLVVDLVGLLLPDGDLLGEGVQARGVLAQRRQQGHRL